MAFKCVAIMLKYLYPNINWSSIESVGFDLDGTLYDESDFIAEVYRPISQIFSVASNKSPEFIYAALMNRWVEVGSSYPRIFEEVLKMSGVTFDEIDVYIKQALEVFRAFNPKISLSSFVQDILDECHNKFNLFVVTDGRESLQLRKVESLGLYRWIPENHIFVTSTLPGGLPKPSIEAITYINERLGFNIREKSIFFGDRLVDKIYSRNVGMQFISVSVMRPVSHIRFEN